ncbi:type II toxin-antitoxin system VapC family toxin [Acidithiobacillus ferrooxidans]|uniref:type II toxin-antitoxin system tRNA(fMet)-specific endonuclease VapC n=1 Tax=Acidithiobacillus ferrooxidans TaxID=920 RepID=UPI001C07BD54|nr:PIN domain-containing protein [Acidithiobacillus ferrooxidans]MBU2856999.1 type II toxin-antitoxin system VapC family toxin [Acidithiobacillus ferrooxidans]MBU2860292.1 type II toxin-antitoxin system VapC family toxin [Acidithiobacillus ferrooxidans]
MHLPDTNICIYIIDVRPLQVLTRFRERAPGTVAISTITTCELAFGVAKSLSERNHRALQMFMAPLGILPFDESVVWQYAQIRSDLEQQGQPIGALDRMIAEHALALGAILVTNNAKKFSRVADLKIENWVHSNGVFPQEER